MQLIPLKEVLAAMERGETFSITFVTADRKRKTGGEIITLDNVCCKKPEKTTVTATIEKINSSRPQNHWQHGTRNLHIQGTEQVRKVHIRLITEFNGQKVIY